MTQWLMRTRPAPTDELVCAWWMWQQIDSRVANALALGLQQLQFGMSSILTVVWLLSFFRLHSLVDTSYQ